MFALPEHLLGQRPRDLGARLPRPRRSSLPPGITRDSILRREARSRQDSASACGLFGCPIEGYAVATLEAQHQNCPIALEQNTFSEIPMTRFPWCGASLLVQVRHPGAGAALDLTAAFLLLEVGLQRFVRCDVSAAVAVPSDGLGVQDPITAQDVPVTALVPTFCPQSVNGCRYLE